MGDSVFQDISIVPSDPHRSPNSMGYHIDRGPLRGLLNHPSQALMAAMKAARALEFHQESQIPPKKGFFPPERNAAPWGSTLLIPLATGGAAEDPAAFRP